MQSKRIIKRLLEKGIKPEQIVNDLCEILNQQREEEIDQLLRKNWLSYRKILKRILSLRREEAIKIIKTRLRYD